MLKNIRTVLAAAAFIVAAYAAAAEMKGDHPDTYVVKRGDTLWDISGKFLQKPWLWPEIWQANPQIQNPHLIYPGDVISLAYLDRVRAAVQQGPREEAPIGALPLSDIEPFLKNLRIADSFEELPRVIGLEGDRMRGAGGQAVYALGLDGVQVGTRFSIVRPTLRYTQSTAGAGNEYRPYREDLDFRGKRIASQTIDWNRSWNSAAMDPGGKLELLGYELAVTDYLLKPFAFERFLKAVNKVIAHHKALVGPAPTPESSPALLLKAGRHVQQFQLDTILYLEGCGNYVKLHTREKTVLLHETLSYVATLLPENRFVRIHKSYLVALDRIERLEANAVHMAGKTLPVGNTYKQSLQAVFARKMQEGG